MINHHQPITHDYLQTVNGYPARCKPTEAVTKNATYRGGKPIIGESPEKDHLQGDCGRKCRDAISRSTDKGRQDRKRGARARTCFTRKIHGSVICINLFRIVGGHYWSLYQSATYSGEANAAKFAFRKIALKTYSSGVRLDSYFRWVCTHFRGNIGSALGSLSLSASLSFSPFSFSYFPSSVPLWCFTDEWKPSMFIVQIRPPPPSLLYNLFFHVFMSTFIYVIA